MRTFVISDAHGYPELIKNALRHGRFDPDCDAFVSAGDLVDRGPDPEGCIELVERYATEVLLGNHDVGVLLDLPVFPQDPQSPGLRPFFLEKVVTPNASSAWKVATAVEGVLITHAGVSSHYTWALQEDCQGDPARLAEQLNTAFRAVVGREPPVRKWDDHGILSEDGPLWFRPRPYSYLLPAAGCNQVVGHTPPIPELEPLGFYMIDPCAFEGMADPGRYRYAVIQAGRVRAEEGTLGRNGASLPLSKPHLTEARR